MAKYRWLISLTWLLIVLTIIIIIITWLVQKGGLTLRENLERIRREKDVSLTDMADLLNVKSQTVREKIDGKSDFKFGEALIIRNTFFPEYDMVYLFSNGHH